MSHGWTFHRSTVIRGRYHFAISEYVWGEEYATEFDVTFNGKKKLLFFRGRECVFSNLNIYVCGQLVDMCDSATHLGHFISSTDS